MEVRLIEWTKNADLLAAKSARYCRTKKSYDEIDMDEPEKLLHSIIKLGHFSVLEHGSFTFEIREASRIFSHQLVRHRMASFSQQSQRTVRFKKPSYVTPPKLMAPSQKESLRVFEETVEKAFKAYGVLLENGIKPEDARFVLPQASTTSLIMTMNCRELLHFFRLRLAKDAQWEIRDVAQKMYDLVKEKAPIIFDYITKDGIPVDE
ncbi:MAG: FAD-dependent thymidylate synthase [Candidatus Ranarchaeia archaeon]|jgi:thymidylate synthase (FAD)